jgi:nitric oxide reductase NorD protein
VGSSAERRLVYYLRALWGLGPALREDDDRPRVSIRAGVICLPAGLAVGDEALALRRAAVAHAAAHLVHSTQRFPLGGLRPLQMALVSLIEDARVERLASRSLPGLPRVWLPFHTAQPGAIPNALSLMARLARALIDPRYEDGDAWVSKGRELFESRSDQLGDPSMSRAIGMLLGNDLGQMRLQFDFGRYLVEPAYRDDSMFLWDLLETPDAPPRVESPVLTGKPTSDAEGTDQEEAWPDRPWREIPPPCEVPAGEVPDTPPYRYPEWDYVIGVYRPGWCTLREQLVRPGAAAGIDEILARHEDVTSRVTRLVKTARIGPTARRRRRIEGNDLDLDACISALGDLRTGRTPSPHVYQQPGRIRRDLAVLWLLDLSLSTREIVPGTGQSVLALAQAATAVVAEAIATTGDSFAVHGFDSSGRADVGYYRFKDFDEPYAADTRARLAGMTPLRSTRMGTALRHARHHLGLQRAARKLIVLVTDGAPHDIDVHDRWYLALDAKRAVDEQTRAGIASFCVSLDPAADAYVARIFGAGNYLVLDQVRRLPEKLALVYLRLAAA